MSFDLFLFLFNFNLVKDDSYFTDIFIIFTINIFMTTKSEKKMKRSPILREI